MTQTATKTEVADRGDVGTVVIRKSTREIGNVRTRTSTDPIHISVRDAVKGEWYDIEVDNDSVKIERVERKLRAAAQKYDVGMNIHPDNPTATDENGKPIEGKVFVSFRTADRDKRPAKTPAPVAAPVADSAKPSDSATAPKPTTKPTGNAKN